jgi:hypothetical protein
MKREIKKKFKKKLEHEEKLKQVRDKWCKENSFTTISCPCGSQFQKRESKRHEKCIQHIEYIQTQNKIQTA